MGIQPQPLLPTDSSTNHQPPTTNMSSNEPSKMSAYGDKAMGAMKENAGWAMGNKQMETEGKAQGAKGDAQLEAARAEQAIGEKDKLKGNVKETAGNVLGNEQWQAEGKGDRLKGEAREKMNI